MARLLIVNVMDLLLASPVVIQRICRIDLLGFWLRNASLVKADNPISDGIVFVFHVAGCVREL